MNLQFLYAGFATTVVFQFFWHWFTDGKITGSNCAAAIFLLFLFAIFEAGRQVGKRGQV